MRLIDPLAKLEAIPVGAAIVLGPLSEDCLESRYHARVELGSNCLSQPPPRETRRHRITVGTRGGHRIVGIRYSDDPREQRNIAASHPIRVSLSVNALMVMANNPRNLGVVVDLPQDPLANHRVLLHLSTLIEIQRTRLLQESRREPDLA